MEKKKNNVLITGVTGMDGSILAEKMIKEGHHVFGLVRRSASPNSWRISGVLKNPMFHLIDGDLIDSDSLYRALNSAQPKLVFNLAAQSFVPYSWSAPVNTFHVNAKGAINLLEAIRNTDKSIRFYQASTSEMFGKVLETPQNEKTPFYPRSPYGVSKVAAHYATINYYESFGIPASSGILFNHEHERRGKQFITRKITSGVASFFYHKLSNQECEAIRLGNLEAKRDWGYAEDYVEAMIKIINFESPETFVIATGLTRTVRELCETTVKAAANKLNLDFEKFYWKGCEENEVGYFDGDPLFIVSKEFYRPAEVDILQGDPSKAKSLLDWIPETSFEEMIQRMFDFDFKNISKNLLSFE